MKYCKFCGSQIEDNAKFCPNCGARLEEERVVNNISSNEEDLPTNGLGIAGFILSLVSIFVPIVYWYFPIIALVLSSIAFAHREGKAQKGLTKAGFIISLVITILKILIVIGIIILFGSLAEYSLEYGL